MAIARPDITAELFDLQTASWRPSFIEGGAGGAESMAETARDSDVDSKDHREFILALGIS
jgi:hypothetical protein